jgi:hypothetical protein
MYDEKDIVILQQVNILTKRGRKEGRKGGREEGRKGGREEGR